MFQPFVKLVLFVALTSGCASLPPNSDRQESYALGDTENTELGIAATRHTSKNPGQSGFKLLSSGLDAFVARAALASAAESSIDAQYYLLHNDLVGRLFIDELIKASERGVRVRLLIDDMAINNSEQDIGFANLDTLPNFEVRIFNPFGRNVSRLSQFLTRFGSVTRRMHNKTFTVDKQVSIFGGRNIGNEYFDADPDLIFSDLDVMSVGAVVDDISISFDKYWNSDVSYPINNLVEQVTTSEEVDRIRQRLADYVTAQKDSEYLQSLNNSDLSQSIRNDDLRFSWGTADVIYDDPAKVTSSRDQTDLHLSTQLTPHTEYLKKELIIFSPYFVPGVEGADDLRSLAKKGVRVRILTNSLASTDVSAVHAGYAKYRKTLLQAGVEIHEIDNALTRAQRKEKKGLSGSSKASLHTKSFVLDRKSVFIGSLNLDPRSVIENTEIGAVIKSENIARGMAEWFDQNIDKIAFRLKLTGQKNGNQKITWHKIENGVEKIYTKEPNTSFWRRFGVGFMRLLPIESQL